LGHIAAGIAAYIRMHSVGFSQGSTRQYFLVEKLIPYSTYVLLVVRVGERSSNSLRLRFKSDRDEIWHRITQSDFRHDVILSR